MSGPTRPTAPPATRAASAPADASQRVGDVIAALVLGTDTLLLLGWLEHALPPEGIAFFDEDPGSRGQLNAHVWTEDAPDGAPRSSWFIAVIQGIATERARPGAHLSLCSTSGRRLVIAQIPDAILDGPQFAQAAAARLGGGGGAAATFLRETLTARATRDTATTVRFLAALLAAVSEEDGVIEIVGFIPGAGLLIQGWSRSLRTGDQEALLEMGAIDRVSISFGHFARNDLPPPARGFVGFVPLFERRGRPALARLYFRIDGRYRRLEILPNKIDLAPGDTSAHLRAMLPSVETGPATQRLLRRASRPRFNGQDTVAQLTVPVAIAVDISAHVEGAGYYVTGWMLDPTNLIQAVILRNQRDLALRVDETWTRVSRADVSEAFRQDDRFRGRLSSDQHNHGFTAFVPTDADPAAEDRFCLELDMGDEACAFLPISVQRSDLVATRRSLLASFDIHKPSARLIAERQVGPMFRKAGARLAQPIPYDLMSAAPSQRLDTAVVIPFVAPSAAINVTLAQFGVDRLGTDEGLTLVCSTDFDDDAVRAVQRYVSFYGLTATVLRARRPADACELLAAGIAAVESENVLVLSPEVFGRDNGWVGKLRRAAHDQPVPCALSPTILYEDFSVKFAGIEAVERSESTPFVVPVSRLAGYSMHWLEKVPTQRVLAASIDCCLLPRAAFLGVGGFSTSYSLAPLKGTDLFLRLADRDVPSFWTPDCAVYSLDENVVGEMDYWIQTGQRVDAWCFTDAWPLHIEGIAPPGPSSSDQR